MRTIAFTANLEPRLPVLAQDWVVEALRERLESSVTQYACTAPIWTFMPDHLHVLLMGMSETSDLKAAIEGFKLKSGIWMHAKLPGIKWQEGYWDRALRWHEGWEAHARYIARNPYRVGLISSEEVWSYTGSIGHDLNEILCDAFW